VHSDLRITCGVEPESVAGSIPDALAHLIHSLSAPFGFFTPTRGLLDGLNLSRGVFSLLSDQTQVDFASVNQLAQAVSDLESIHLVLSQIDSEEFAIWCGLGKNEGRVHLLDLMGMIDRALIRVRGAQLQLIFAEYRPSPKALFRSLTQLGLVGVGCDARQLQRAWPTSARKPLSNKWKSQYESMKVLKDTGMLVERESSIFSFEVKWKGVGNMDLAVGLMRNHLVLELSGVRRFVELPAACSRMEPGVVRLSKNRLALDFTVDESEWPRS